MKKRVADIVTETLIENGITQNFCVVGGGAMHLNNAFELVRGKLDTVYNHHEQACAMAATAYGRLSGRMASVCVTSGPGGINTFNGVQGAYVDSVPMIVICGHPRYDTTVEACGLNLRSRGVQENDAVSQVKNITKYAKLVKDPKDVKKEVQYACDMAMDGRRGPVWLSIPLDVQGALVDEEELTPCVPFKGTAPIPESEIREAFEELSRAKRPCILTGSGIRTSGSMEAYRNFTKKVRIPIVGGCYAQDTNVYGDELYYGESGSVGPRCGNFILQSADMILVLGNSLSTSQTGFNVEGFAPDAKIIMVDATADEGRKPGLKVSKILEGDLKDFFAACEKMDIRLNACDDWIAHCDMVRNHEKLPRYEVLNILPEGDGKEAVHPAQFWKKFFDYIEDDAIIAHGNSSCCITLLQEGVKTRQQRLTINYHCGSMGDDLPAAVGAATLGEGTVYCVSGDGSFMLNLQELQTIALHKYPIKIVVFNNNGYDNIRNTCVNYFGGLKNGCDPESGVSMPDFGKVASAFEMPYYRVDSVNALEAGLEWMKKTDGPCFLEIQEIKAKKRAPVLASVMDENGVFKTPQLHVMTPLLEEDLVNKFIYTEK